MARWQGFIGGSNTGQAFSLDAERTVNLYVEQATSRAAANIAALLPTPGFVRWSGSSMGETGSRGAIVADGRLFWVIGTGFYEFSQTGAATRWGVVAQDSNPAQLVYNGKVGGQVGIASGGSIYTFTLASNAFAGPHFGAASATMLAYADSYGLAFDKNTGKVYLSGLNNLTSWSSGTFFQREKFPDPWQTMFVDPNGLIWLIGTETFEVWYDANPTSTQPWAPLSGVFGRFGIEAPFAFGVSAVGQFWIARSPEGGPQVVTTTGSIPKPVSTPAVANALAGYRRNGQLADAECLIYQDLGHTFANFSFAAAHDTWSVDAGSQSWAERGQWNSAMQRYDVWAPRVHAYCFGRHFVGDRNTGTIWDMDSTYATDVDGMGIRRLRRAPALIAEHKRLPIDQLEILMDTGVASQGTDPQAVLRMSFDGGRTFGNERRAGVGRIGDYRKRVYWTRCGINADAVAEIVWADDAPTRVVDAWLNNAEQAA